MFGVAGLAALHENGYGLILVGREESAGRGLAGLAQAPRTVVAARAWRPRPRLFPFLLLPGAS